MNISKYYNDITIVIVLYYESYDLISKTLHHLNNFKKIIIDNSKRWIYPTESWKISNLIFQKIDIDKDYYVKVKNTK